MRLAAKVNSALIVSLLAGLVFLISLISAAYADQGSFTNSGGSASGGAGVVISSTVAAPAGTVNIDCPALGAGGCTGGSLTFASNDGTTSISATFTGGTAAEGCSGGGRGGHITCGYTLTAYFSGNLTVSGATQAIVGVTYQSFTVGYPAIGTTAYNSAYTPFYYSDSEQILRSDDLLGTNQVTFGSQGSGVGQFYGAYGIALDSAGRIYVSDTYNCRIVRFDDMNGTNWISYGGTCGSGVGEFYDPSAIAVDSNGAIYIMDTGNSRLVRIDDMNGSKWTTLGSVGSGVGQFASFVSVAVDASNRIYVADAGNRRIVRMDDMAGTNWTELTSSPPVGGISYSFASPVAVAVDSAGKIYVADDGSYAPAVVRVDDMTGANWTSLYVSPQGSTGLNSIAVDSSGTVYTGGGGVRLMDDMAGVLTSSGAIAPYGTYYVFGVTPVPATPHVPAISLTPGGLSFSQNVRTQSAAQSVTIANFGASPLDLSSIAASGVFSETNNCPNQLAAGSNCTVSVTFTPTATGPASGSLIVKDDSGNAGTTQTVTLVGTGTTPGASVSPTTASFSGQLVGTTGGTRSVKLTSTGTGPLQITGIAATAPFSETNNCSASIAAGSSCTIDVSFTPDAPGSASGTLTISDNAGTQTVKLTGSGIAPVTLSQSSLNFGKAKVGATSKAKTVTLTNHQKVSVSFSGIAASAGFGIASNSCGTSIGAGSKCSVGVTFSPAGTGVAAGTLTFTDSAGDSPQVVSLRGTGN
jgi:sugar lactone lactonase YvrE